MDATPMNLLIVAAAAVAAGFVNAVAGGGTLISFPALTFVGIPAVSANVTNTVALSPGYLGGTLAQRRDLEAQTHRLWRILPAAALGGLTGGVLLLITSEAVFRALVPWLILTACALLAAQNRIRGWVARREARVLAAEQAAAADRDEDGDGDPCRAAAPRTRHDVSVGAVVAVFAGSIYGGYFGAGLGIILLAVLGALIDDDLVRINALKQAVSLTVNTTAALFFVFSGRVVWGAAAIMAVGALGGGTLGGRLASRLNPSVLRGVVIAAGVVIAIVYLTR